MAAWGAVTRREQLLQHELVIRAEVIDRLRADVLEAVDECTRLRAELAEMTYERNVFRASDALGRATTVRVRECVTHGSWTSSYDRDQIIRALEGAE